MTAAPSKSELLAAGRERVVAMCAANCLPVPTVHVVPHGEWRLSRTCAFWRRDAIYVCPERCAAPGVAGRAWSWPGYAVDRTPYGVLAHELGHHFDWHLSQPATRRAYSGALSAEVREAAGEPGITSYAEENAAEWFAEAFRLFVTNPDLLWYIRPRTFNMLRGRIEPVEERPWHAVLADALPRTLAAARTRVERAARKK
jgi:hypothetical protein